MSRSKTAPAESEVRGQRSEDSFRLVEPTARREIRRIEDLQAALAQFAEYPADGTGDPPSRILWRGRHRRVRTPPRVFDRTGISDEGRSEVRAGLALRAAKEVQVGTKVKQL